MFRSRSVSYFLFISAVLFHLCMSVEKGSFYHIKNFGDQSYIRVEYGGELCKHMGQVGTSATLNATSAAYRWRYSELTESLKWLDIDSNGDFLQDNVLTMEPTKPYCYPTYRNINTITVFQNVYRVQSVVNGSCMKSIGVGAHISWSSCDENDLGQQWQFIEA